MPAMFNLAEMKNAYVQYARVRRYLKLTQRDVSMGTGIPISRISAAESGRGSLNAAQERVLRDFLETRLRITREVDSLDDFVLAAGGAVN
jgi:transcriptional regulator with XRE-family HTH domain